MVVSSPLLGLSLVEQSEISELDGIGLISVQSSVHSGEANALLVLHACT
jgi:hypothetical protein